MNPKPFEKKTLTVISEPGREVLSTEGQEHAEAEAELLGAPDVDASATMPQDKPLVFDENPDPQNKEYSLRKGIMGS